MLEIGPGFSLKSILYFEASCFSTLNNYLWERNRYANGET